MNLLKLLSELNDIIEVYDGKITDGSVQFNKRHRAEIWVEFPNEDDEGITLFNIAIKDVS